MWERWHARVPVRRAPAHFPSTGKSNFGILLMTRMRFHHALRLCIFWLIPFFALGQQVKSASVTGTIVDIQNDVIPAATVVLSGPTAADHFSTTSDGSGLFTFNDLRAAVPYRLTVTANGFAPWTSPSIVLKLGQDLNLGNVQLQIAVVQTTVTAMTMEEIATQEVHVEEKQRILGVFPNFYVTYDPHPVPLTAKLKFQLALRSTIDPISILSTAAFAGINQYTDTPDYPQTVTGYFQRFGVGMADNAVSSLIGGAILPSLFRQDPRYFYQGTGTTASRIRHAAAWSVLCKGDNGHWQFNYSGVGGDLSSGAISNLYYPPSNHGPGLVFYNAALSAAGRVAGSLAQEFVFRRWTPTAKNNP